VPTSGETRRGTGLAFGADALCRDPSVLRGAQRLGMVTNDAARLATDASQHTRVALHASGVPIVRLFSPEHGIGANAPDGHAVHDGVDTRTGVPVVSLYGEQLRPTPEQLRDLDAVLFDVPDVGARFYTYTWTLWHTLAACADANVPLFVLDRPNPLGGNLARAEGPMLEPACRSFLGEDAIPIVHACTLGELARVWRAERHPHASLHVVPVQGWSRAQDWTALGAPWVPTSPAMPAFASARWYPGLCLFEATNLSVGRGTTTPFTCVGAPWLDAEAVCDALYRRSGVTVTPLTFTPTTDRYAEHRCAGVSVQAIDPGTIGPVALGLLLLAAVMATHPEAFRWNAYPTAANPGGDAHLRRLLGSSIVAELVANPEHVTAAAAAGWTRVPEWTPRLMAADALLYE
jgi:uncharacterized protein YbbC (DUF1343 family)